MGLSAEKSLRLGSTRASSGQRELAADADFCRGLSVDLLLWIFLKGICKQMDNFQSTSCTALRTLLSFLSSLQKNIDSIP